MSKCDWVSKIETDFQSLLTKMEGSSAAEKQKADFSIRVQSILSWFQQCSFRSRLEFLFKLLCNINSKQSVKKLLIGFNAAIGKDHIYSASMCMNNFPNDKILNDNNRTLSKEILEAVMQQTLTWFSKLEDPEQVAVMFELLQVADGATVRILYPFIKKQFEDWTPREKVLLVTDFEPIPELPEILPESTPVPKTNRLTFLLDSGIDLVPLDEKSEDPFVIDVLKKRENWCTSVTKYKSFIESLKPKEKSHKESKHDKKHKAKKSGKKQKKHKKEKGKSNKSKSSKSSRAHKKKKGSKSKMEDLDQLQLLPVWVAKKILNYFDNKTLTHLKAVNSYWEFLIEGILEDRAVRKAINKQIQRSEKILHGQSIGSLQAPVKSLELTITERKLMKLDERGCIAAKAVYNSPINGHKFCLQIDAVEGESGGCKFPIGKYEIFPRSTPLQLKSYSLSEIRMVQPEEFPTDSDEVDDDVA